ncbi:MAG: T9SS type A sorting domain-containing protein [Saprospiraceae bacterium]|nr:T9SS type A sorting domain-containing protein [Saprospiraceae bacterium]
MRLLILLSLFISSGTVLAQIPAPDFTITTSDGQVRQLYQDYVDQQKLVVIEAFFTSCPPCSAHATPFQNLYTAMQAAYPGQVEFILLSTLMTDTNVKVGQYLSSRNMTMLGAGKDGGSITALQPYMGGAYGAFQGTPTFFIIAPDNGHVFFDIRGNTAAETMSLLQEKIEELLSRECTVSDPFGNPMEEVEMRVDAAGFDTTFLVDGIYDLSGVASLQNRSYTLKPSRDGHPSGLTTFDLVLISKHILAIEPLNCPWQLVAADVNCSGSITTFDIVTARKVILGIESNFPCGSLRFMPDTASLSNGQCQSFTGVNLGDVNAGPCTDSLMAHAEDRRASNKIWFQDRLLHAGETATVHFYLDKSATAEGLQLALQVDPAKAAVRQLSSASLPAFNVDCWHVENGQLRLSWLHVPGIEVARQTPLFSCELRAHQETRIAELLQWAGSPNFPAELYAAGGDRQQLDLSTRDALAKVFPNPAEGTFSLSLDAGEGDYLIQLSDIQGKKVLEQHFNLQQGFNQLEVNCPGVPPGLYMILANGAPVGKLVLK